MQVGLIGKIGRVISSEGGGVASPGALASRFDGTNDMTAVSTATAGIADGRTFSTSLWFRFPTSGTFRFFFHAQALATNFDMSVQANGQILLRLENTNSDNVFSVLTGTGFDDNAWHHYAWSANCTTGKRTLFIDGAQVTNDTNAPTTHDIDLASTDYEFPDAVTVDVDLSEIWMSTEFVDFSDSATRAKFISGGLPVDLGSDGSTPTGTAPEIYAPNGNIGTNAGSGGNGTVTGAPESIAGPGA